MAEQWWAVIDSTGEAVSFGTVLADPLPAGLVALKVTQQPDEKKRWDAATKALVDVPPPIDPVDSFDADPTVTAILAKLTKADQATLIAKLEASFGKGKP